MNYIVISLGLVALFLLGFVGGYLAACWSECIWIQIGRKP